MFSVLEIALFIYIHIFGTPFQFYLKGTIHYYSMAPHSSTLSWKIPWMEEHGGLQSMGSLRVRHDWATSPSVFTFMHWRRKWQPTPVFLLENPREGGAWWAAVYGVTQSWTQLEWLNSSSSNLYYKGFPGSSVVKNSPANAGEPGSITGSGISLGEKNGNPLQYSCLENSRDRGAWLATVHGVAKELDAT